MADNNKPQNYKNHRSYDWLHLVVTMMLVPAIAAAIALLLPLFSERTAVFIMKLLLLYYGLCMLVLAIKVRRYPLVLQDRIIRLEMKLRLQKILPPDDWWQINGLTTDQIVALRFAADDQLPALMRKVLDENIRDRDQIKRLVKFWVADFDRI